MKRFLLIGLIGALMLSMLCVGLFLGVLFTPIRSQIGQALDGLVNRALDQRVAPRFLIQSSEPSQNRPEDEKGILIAGVVAGSPAEAAGLRRGDILLEVEGEEVNSLRELQQALSGYEAGDQVELRVRRGDKEITLSAELDSAGSENRAGGLLGILPCCGMAFERQAPGRSFEILTEPGFRILEVVEGSPAEEAGLKPGETITGMDGEPFDREADLAALLAERDPGDRVSLQVTQPNGDEREVTVTLGENPDREGAAWLGIRYTRAMRMVPGEGMPRLPESALPDDGRIPFIPFDELPFPEGIPFLPGQMQQGALIREVEAGSPAEEAGLEVGQLIQAVDGKELEEAQDLADIIASHEPGDSVSLTVYDSAAPNADSREIEVTLGENPENEGAAWLGIRFSFIKIQLETEELPEG